jgi:hypothetical protein
MRSWWREFGERLGEKLGEKFGENGGEIFSGWPFSSSVIAYI